MKAARVESSRVEKERPKVKESEESSNRKVGEESGTGEEKEAEERGAR